MTTPSLDRNLYVIGDASAHVEFLNCEKLSERSHIHGWHVAPHFHEGLTQLFVFCAGQVEGQIDYSMRTINGPAMAWLPQMCTHAFKYPKDMEGWVITVPSSDVDQLAKGNARMERWINQPQILQGKKHQKILNSALALVELIAHEQRHSAEEHSQALEALFRLLVIQMHRGVKAQSFTSAGASDRGLALVRGLKSLIDAQFNTGHSVADYANMLAVTPTHLSRTAKTVTGRTAGEIIQDRIVLEAKRKLVFTDIPITEIAFALRFASPSYFARFFKKQTNESPKAFRARMRRSAA